MTKEDKGELIILAEKEPHKSKEIFNEYCKQEKTLKEIAQEIGVSYNTAKQYSSNYKYKQRLEYTIELETSKITEQKKNIISEHKGDLKEALDKSYNIFNMALRNSKGSLLLNLDAVERMGVYFDEQADYKAFDKWTRTALNNIHIANEILKTIDEVENKLCMLE